MNLQKKNICYRNFGTSSALSNHCALSATISAPVQWNDRLHDSQPPEPFHVMCHDGSLSASIKKLCISFIKKNINIYEHYKHFTLRNYFSPILYIHYESKNLGP